MDFSDAFRKAFGSFNCFYRTSLDNLIQEVGEGYRVVIDGKYPIKGVYSGTGVKSTIKVNVNGYDIWAKETVYEMGNPAVTQMSIAQSAAKSRLVEKAREVEEQLKGKGAHVTNLLSTENIRIKEQNIIEGIKMSN